MGQRTGQVQTSRSPPLRLMISFSNNLAEFAAKLPQVRASVSRVLLRRLRSTSCSFLKQVARPPRPAQGKPIQVLRHGMPYRNTTPFHPGRLLHLWSSNPVRRRNLPSTTTLTRSTRGWLLSQLTLHRYVHLHPYSSRSNNNNPGTSERPVATARPQLGSAEGQRAQNLCNQFLQLRSLWVLPPLGSRRPCLAQSRVPSHRGPRRILLTTLQGRCLTAPQ